MATRKVSKRNWKALRPKSLGHAVELDAEFALTEKRLPAKRICEQLETSLPTYYRWVAEQQIPLGKVLTFERLCGASYVAEFLGVASGKIVIDMPRGRVVKPIDLNALSVQSAAALLALSECYAGQGAPEEAVSRIDEVLRGLAFHRENAKKLRAPELDLFAE